MRPWRCFGLISVLSCASIAHAQTQTPPPDPTPVQQTSVMIDHLGTELLNQEASITDRARRADAELSTMDRAQLPESDWARDWAGVYAYGDGLGENVRVFLAPKAGICFTNYGCMGFYGGDEGDIEEVLPDGLKLRLHFGAAKGSYLSERIYFVKWGTHRFLASPWQLIKFVNEYNAGRSPDDRIFGCAKLKAPGQTVLEPASESSLVVPNDRPQLPEPYAAMLRDNPISLKVVKAHGQLTKEVVPNVHRFSCQLEFQGGTDSGVFVGMEFRYLATATKPRTIGEAISQTGRVRITRADATTCTAEFAVFVDPPGLPQFPAEGETVWTAPPQLDSATPPKAPSPR